MAKARPLVRAVSWAAPDLVGEAAAPASNSDAAGGVEELADTLSKTSSLQMSPF